MKRNKIEDAYFDCLRQMYKQSTPKGDFDKMLRNAKINEFNQKIIPFNDYILEQNKFENILNNIIKKYKFKKSIIKEFKTLVHLGASPKIKHNKNK